MGDGIGERLQLLVRGGQFFRALLLALLQRRVLAAQSLQVQRARDMTGRMTLSWNGLRM